jgi:MFS family permease
MSGWLDRTRAHAHASAGGLPRTFWLLCAGMFINRAGSFVVPFLAVYLTQVRGYSIATAGVVAALYGAGAMLASILGGYFADHIGRRATMLGALTLGGFGMIALGFAHDIRVIAPAAFTVALLGEAYRPAMQAAVSDLVPPEDRVRAFGLLYWVINMGYSVGVTLGGALASASFFLLFVGDGVTSLLFALLVSRAVPETRPAPAPHDAHKRRPGLVRGFFAPYFDGPFGLFVLLSILILMVFMQHVAALPIDMSARGVSRAWLGAVLGINGVVIVVLQPLLASRLQRWNRSRVLAAGTALVGLGFGFGAVAHGPGLFGLGVLVWTLGEICVLPIANAVVGDVAPSDMRGRYQGAYGLSFGLAGFTAPLVGTFVMQRFGAATLWCGCLALGLLVSTGHLLLAPRLTRMRLERLARSH